MEGDGRRGTTPQLDDRTLAHLALAVYESDVREVQGWSRLDVDGLARFDIPAEFLEKKECGFQAAVFRNGQRHVIAFAGTDEWKEIGTNVAQAMGRESEQYRAAVTLATAAKLVFGKTLCFTGHSLGGGLAALASIATDVPAVTFNAAGIHSKSFTRLGIEPKEAQAAASEGLVRAYSVNGEVLTKVQELLPIPKAPGSRIRLEDPDPPKGITSMLPITRVARSIRLHSMATVVKAVEADSRFRNPPPEATALLNKADAVLAKSGLSDRSIERVRTALERRVATEVAANRFPPSEPVKDQGRSR